MTNYDKYILNALLTSTQELHNGLSSCWTEPWKYNQSKNQKTFNIFTT